MLPAFVEGPNANIVLGSYAKPTRKKPVHKAKQEVVEFASCAVA